MNFPAEEYAELSFKLENYHAVFYKLWSIGHPSFSEEIKTAAVSFNQLGEYLDFHINPNFWKTLTLPQKLFTICHECVHIILNHGLRIQSCPKSDYDLAGQGLDIVVNHNLIEKFGFKRQEIDPKNEYCWIDTVFPNQTIDPDRSFEYYFNLLKQQAITISIPVDGKSKTGSAGGRPVDDHKSLVDFSDLIKKLNEDLTGDQKQGLKSLIIQHGSDENEDGEEPGGLQAGNGAGHLWQFIDVSKVKPKKKWETVIKQWSLKYFKDADFEQWARVNRRLAFYDGELFLPSEAEEESFDKDRIDVWFFQDTSGSCWHLAKRFFAAAASLPKDRFNIRLFNFDTRVHETDLKTQKVYGGGGTSFTCINKFVEQEILNKNIKHPQIFVITDGYGDVVNPGHPKKWYWFLTHNYTYCLPKQSPIFMLKDFE